MKKLIVALSLSIAFTPPPIEAQQTPYFPPDYYNDFQREAYSLWENPTPGWVIDTEGDLRPDVQFVTEGALPRTYIRRDARMSFVMSAVDTSVNTPDTLWRLDMQLVGAHAQYPDAAPHVLRDRHLNFYLPHCGTDGVTGVQGYNRIVYDDIYPDIDLWVYSGARGQKMMFVVGTHGDPANIEMLFTGQDDLGVDVNGWLKLQMENRWVGLPEAVAYQVDTNQNVIPVSWTPNYVANNNTGIVTFDFDGFDRYKPLVFLIGPPPPLGAGDNEEPGLCWSTYCGGSDDEYIVQSDEDAAHNYYVTGNTSSTIASFPQALGISTYSGGVVSFVLKFNASDVLQWKSFYGGSAGQECLTEGCTVTQLANSSGVYIAGHTTAPSLTVPAPNGQHEFEPSPTFIAKFRLGDGYLIWASYFEADRINGIASSAGGRVYLTGRSTSYYVDEDYLDVPPPSTSSAYWGGPTAPWSVSTGFVAMLNIQDKLNWFTFFTNNSQQDDFNNWIGLGWGTSEIAVLGDRVIVQGNTNCATIPNAGCPTGAYCEQLAEQWEYNAVVYEFDLDGVPVWSTYFGETGSVALFDLYMGTTVAIDPVTGDVVIAGAVESTGSVPIVPGTGWYSSEQSPGWSPFVARFDGTTRDLIWSSYIPITSAGYPAAIRSVAFDSEGALYIGGEVAGLEVPLNEYGGYYHQPNVNLNEGSSEDAFLVCIGPDQDPGPAYDYELRFATYFGGEAAANAHEMILDIAQRTTNSNIYVVGGTSKGEDVGSYFPLDDGGGVPSYWPDWAGGLQEGFISSFCPEGLTSMPALQLPIGKPLLRYDDATHISIAGLPDGTHQIALLDMSGRLVRTNRTSSTAGRSTSIDISSLNGGVYLVRCASELFRFTKP